MRTRTRRVSKGTGSRAMNDARRLLPRADCPPLERPAIRPDGLINPASKQSTWGSKRPLNSASFTAAWQSVGEHLPPLPPTTRQRC